MALVLGTKAIICLMPAVPIAGKTEVPHMDDVNIYDSGLKFPLTWNARVLAYSSAGDIAELITDVLERANLPQYACVPGNVSSSGTYRTWVIKALVPDYPTLRILFSNLEQLPGVKMLI